MFNGWDFEFYRSIFVSSWWYGLFFVIYLGGLLCIARSNSAELKQIFVWPFLILLITVFNPLVMEPILQRTNWQDRYDRFYWMLPVELLSAYLLAVLIDRQKRREERALMILMAACLIFLCGGSATELALDDNIYRIDSDIIKTAELIDAVSEKERPVVFYDEETYYWIRQYDASIISGATSEEMEIYRWMKADEIDSMEQYEGMDKAVAMFVQGVEVEPETIRAVFDSREVDFFVRNKDFYSADYLQQLNLVYVGEAEGYELYRCMHD